MHPTDWHETLIVLGAFLASAFALARTALSQHRAMTQSLVGFDGADLFEKRREVSGPEILQSRFEQGSKPLRSTGESIADQPEGPEQRGEATQAEAEQSVS
jgi:hypothetical protein